MPQNLELVNLPTGFTFKEAYALLNDAEKAAFREAITELGTSKETMHRWLRENSVPLVWQQHFKIQLNKHLNANGKNLI